MVHLHFQCDYTKYQASHVGAYSLALILGSQPPSNCSLKSIVLAYGM